MPPKIKFTKEQIINAAIGIVREKGIEYLSARAVASELGSSPQPLFSYFENMEELKKAVILGAEELYNSYTQKVVTEEKYPIYKSIGIAYIKFAREEKQLFKLLFMCENTEETQGNKMDISGVIDVIKKNVDIPDEKAELFHFEMWTFVHGIAAMTMTGYINLSEDMISEMLTDIFEGLKLRFKEV